ncbi:MAG TPA: terminase gpA endonuclease subunit [Pirellulales bacterium]|jgi:phage terminase large subunit GpA-like protein
MTVDAPQIIDLYPSAIGDRVYDLWEPRPAGPSWPWICENVCAPNGSPFDSDNHPWGRGVCETFDDPEVREIDLMWGSRLGKTFLGHSLLLFQSAINPMPGMFGSADQNLATSAVREKLYPMLEHCEPLAGQLKPPSRRSMLRIDLANCHFRISWSGSENTLADFGAYILHGGEISKWSSQTGREADPLELFLERAKEFPDYKAILESTPALKGKCRIDARMEQSQYHNLFVPCPKCRGRQILVFGDSNPGSEGIIWDKGPDGHTDKDVAYSTARYVCVHCKYEIYDDQRPAMMRAGVWAPRGCSVDKQGRIIGIPKQAGRRSVGFQLASWYSLQLRWGDMAAKWCTSFRRPRLRQNFVNSWGGMAFEHVTVNVTPEALAERLATEVPLGTVPPGVAFLTIGVDRQQDHWVFVVIGWGAGEWGHLIDYGITTSETDLLEGVLRRVYLNADETRAFRAKVVFYDSGDETEKVYKFCRIHSSYEQPILPCKGEDYCSGRSYIKKRLGEGKKDNQMRRAELTAKGQILVLVSKDYWQPVIQDYVQKGAPWKPASLSFCLEAAGDLDLCQQLLNGGRLEKKNSKGRDARIWVKKNENDPDDFRDAVEYARCAAEAYLMGRWDRVRLMAQTAGSHALPEITPANRLRTPDPQPAQSKREVRSKRRKLSGSRLGRPIIRR